MMNDRIAWTDDDFADGRQRARLSLGDRFPMAGMGSRGVLKRLPVPAIVVICLVMAAVVASGVAWLIRDDDGARVAGAEPPLIKADERPIKVYPDSPGGMDVPNRDKLVYSRLKGEGERREVERLLPGPETPLPPPAAAPDGPPAAIAEAEPAFAPAPSTRSPTGSPFPIDSGRPEGSLPPIEDDGAPVAARPLPPSSATAKPAGERTGGENKAADEKAAATRQPGDKPASERAADKATAKPAAKAAAAEKPVAQRQAAAKSAAEKPAAEKAARPTAKEAEKPAAAKVAMRPTGGVEKAAAKPVTGAPATSRVYVQLLAARSEDDVLGAWRKLQSRNGDLLGGMSGTVAKADLGDRGVFYRLRAGPIASESEARTLCSALAGRNVTCLIVRPAG